MTNDECDDVRMSPEYWATQIEEKGIDKIEAIYSHDRSYPGNEFVAARKKAIESYRTGLVVNKLKSPQYILVASVLILVVILVIVKFT